MMDIGDIIGSKGTGGLMIIFASEFSNFGIIESNGSDGGTGSNAGGGGSGAGSINIFYKELIKKGTVMANGGKRGANNSNIWRKAEGGAGGAGSITITNIIPMTWQE